MPLDPDAAQLLVSMAEAMAPVETMTPAEARVAAAGLAALLPARPAVAAIWDDVVKGAELRVRIYRPHIAGVLPAFLYIHGGGWVIGGDLDIYDPLCDRLANEGRCLVVSVGYRLAPENRYPIPLMDCAAAAAWIVDSAEELGVDPDRLAVGGDSSGANLAASLALWGRDHGTLPFCFQLLVYPPVRCRRNAAEYPEGLDVAVLTRSGMAWYWNQYLDENQSGNEPYASPLDAADLSDLPPAMVITAEYDVLRDEVFEYVGRLRRDAVDVEHLHYYGMFHGFLGFGTFLPRASEAVGFAAEALRRALHGEHWRPG